MASKKTNATGFSGNVWLEGNSLLVQYKFIECQMSFYLKIKEIESAENGTTFLTNSVIFYYF